MSFIPTINIRGTRQILINAQEKYASGPYWGEKNAAHVFDVDKGLSSNNLSDYNHYQLGIYIIKLQPLSFQMELRFIK